MNTVVRTQVLFLILLLYLPFYLHDVILHCPELMSNYYDIEATRGIALVGNHAYIVGTDFYDPFLIVDINNPASSEPLGSYAIGGYSVAIDENYAYVATYNNSLAVIKINELGNEIINNSPPVSNTGEWYTGIPCLAIKFNGSDSYNTDGTIVSYVWDLGDGSTATGISVDHTYTSTGTYTVTLTVKDNDGATDVDTVNVEVVHSDLDGTKLIQDGETFTIFAGESLTISDNEAMLIESGGILIIESGGELIVETGGIVVIDGTVDNTGMITNLGTIGIYGSGTLNNLEGGVVNNEAGGVIENYSNYGMINNAGTISSKGTINNYRTINSEEDIEKQGAIKIILAA